MEKAFHRFQVVLMTTLQIFEDVSITMSITEIHEKQEKVQHWLQKELDRSSDETYFSVTLIVLVNKPAAM